MITLNIDIKVNQPQPQPPAVPGVFTVRKWGDDTAVRLMGATTRNVGSNFQPMQLCTVDASGRAWFGAVSQFQKGVDELYLKGLQYDQRYHARGWYNVYGEISRIYNWLINNDGVAGRPYWYKTTALVFGTMLFGGQKVKVKTDAAGQPIPHIQRGKFPNGDVIEDILLYELDGVRKSQIEQWQTLLSGEAPGKAGQYLHEKFPYWIQHGTSADISRDGQIHDIYTDRPRDVEIFHIVWSWEDFPHNETTRAKPLYIAAALLE